MIGKIKERLLRRRRGNAGSISSGAWETERTSMFEAIRKQVEHSDEPWPAPVNKFDYTVEIEQLRFVVVAGVRADSKEPDVSIAISIYSEGNVHTLILSDLHFIKYAHSLVSTMNEVARARENMDTIKGCADYV